MCFMCFIHCCNLEFSLFVTTKCNELLESSLRNRLIGNALKKDLFQNGIYVAINKGDPNMSHAANNFVVQSFTDNVFLEKLAGFPEN